MATLKGVKDAGGILKMKKMLHSTPPLSSRTVLSEICS